MDDAETAPRSRSGRTSSDRSAASPSLARCGWSASSALESPGFPSIFTPSTRRRAFRAPSSTRATARARRTASGRGSPTRASTTRRPRRRLEHAAGARAGGGRARGGAAPRLPRPRHGRLLGRGPGPLPAPVLEELARERRHVGRRHRPRARRPRLGAGRGRLDRSRAVGRRDGRARVRDRLARARGGRAAARGARAGHRAGARRGPQA